jgi:hypothetical protein
MISPIELVRLDVLENQSIWARGHLDKLRDLVGTQFPPSSVPGEFPHRRTGGLQDGLNETTEIDEGGVQSTFSSSRVEGNPLVPVYLELGTSRMAARPFMTPSCADAQNVTQELVAT